MTTVTFKTLSWTRDVWTHERTNEKLGDIFNEVKSYVGLSEEFNCRDFYGNLELCRAKITNIIMDEYYIYITIKCNINIPERYIPTPTEIIKPNFIKKTGQEKGKEFYSKFNFLFPTSYSIGV